jgi:hypothetical protein
MQSSQTHTHQEPKRATGNAGRSVQDESGRAQQAMRDAIQWSRARQLRKRHLGIG